MKVLKQIGFLFTLCLAAMAVERLLPFAFPASVIALLMLLALLLTRMVRVEQVREKSDFLLGNLPFFFIPSCVGITGYADALLPQLGAFLAVCLISTVVVFAVTAWTVQLTMRLMDGREKK